MRIGLVFSGGGGKGAYEIGVWRALRALGLENLVSVVSGTSVGALNAALFLKGDLINAESIWDSISPHALMPLETGGSDSVFSHAGLETLVEKALCQKDRTSIEACYVTIKRLQDGQVQYHDLRPIVDPNYRRLLLLASAALPGVYPPVKINGEKFVDGGANGDNSPVHPLLQHKPSVILVVHLSSGDNAYSGQGLPTEVIDLYPSKDLGGFLTGTIDFSAHSAAWRRELGYRDAMKALASLVPRREADTVSIARNSFPLHKEGRTDKKKRKAKEKENIQMEKINFEQQDLRQQYEARIAQLRAIAQSPQVTTKVLWDATVARYAGTIDKVKVLLGQEELKGEVTEKLARQMEAFLEKCQKPEFHIALVGAIKAGKSSLINAILGENLASTEVTPETAALTKFRGSHSDNLISITFYTQREWDKLWTSAKETRSSKYLEEYRELNAEAEKSKWVGHDEVCIACDSCEQLKEEIQKWTSSRSATHYFVKEVEVALKGLDLPEGVILVDTPGLNDAVAYRSQITKNYIDRANAVFVCVKADKLSGPELNTIYGVFANTRYNPEKVYIIATQQDTLNDPIEDWKKQRRVWLGYLKEKSCYGEQRLAEKNLIATSGYFYTLLRELKAKGKDNMEKSHRFQLISTGYKMQYEQEELMKHYSDLLSFTGIDDLKRRMENEIIDKYKNLLIDDIRNGYGLLKDNISELMQIVRKRQDEIIAASSKSIDELREMKEKNLRDLDEARRNQEELNQLYKTVKETSSKQIKQITKSIRELGGTR